MAIKAQIEHLGITVPEAYFAISEVNGGRLSGEWRGTFWGFATEEIAQSTTDRRSFLAVDAVVPYKNADGSTVDEPMAALFGALKEELERRFKGANFVDC